MILYHYSSNYVFNEIITNKKIRLSPLTQSNDTNEGKHILDLVKEIIPVDHKNKKQIIDDLEELVSTVFCLGFCLSKEPNSLSQWRGYADNAQGIAIGFDRDLMKEIAKSDDFNNHFGNGKLAPVFYQDDLIKNEIEQQILPKILTHYEAGEMTPPRKGTLLTPLTEDEKRKDLKRYERGLRLGYDMLNSVIRYSYVVKSKFFQEENEWRLFSLFYINDWVGDIKNVKFQANQNELKPYQDLPERGFDPILIKEVFLGPKNITPIEVIRLFLDENGFKHVRIVRSGGSYR